MTKETRIGLLVGLLFIVLFALVLSELTETSPQLSAAMDDNLEYDWTTVIEPTTIPPRTHRQSTAPPDPNSLRLLGEILSGRAIHDGGGTVNLTSAEWLQRWQRFHDGRAGIRRILLRPKDGRN